MCIKFIRLGGKRLSKFSYNIINSIIPTYIFSLLIVVLFSTNSYCQQVKIVLQNFNTKKAVSDASIFSSSGELLAVSNDTGIFTLKHAENIYISHISFQDTFATVNDIDTLHLTPTNFFLNEVTIYPKTVNYTHLVLTAYFRIWHLKNNIPEFYLDGIADYYMPLFEKKKKIKAKVLEFRKFYNPSFIKTKTKSSMILNIAESYVPNLSKIPIVDKLWEPYKTQKSFIDENGQQHYNIQFVDKKDNLNIDAGYIIKNMNGKTIKYQFNIPSFYSGPQSGYKFLGYRYKDQGLSLIGYYKTEKNIYYPYYFKSNRIMLVKHKKEKDFQKHDLHREILVIKAEYVAKKISKKSKKSFKIRNDNSSFRSQYWLNPNFFPPFKLIENQFNIMLIMYPNDNEKLYL